MNQSAKERYHIAKLALFNVRLMDALQKSGVEVQKLIDIQAKQNGMQETPNLLHQGTFLQFGYTCLVWLWESAKVEKIEDLLLKRVPEVAKRLELEFPCESKIHGERNIEDWKAVIRLMRNALGHGRVEVTEESFVFSDQNKHGNNAEKAPTKLTLSWEDVGKLSEVVIHSMSPILWPEHGKR